MALPQLPPQMVGALLYGPSSIGKAWIDKVSKSNAATLGQLWDIKIVNEPLIAYAAVLVRHSSITD